MPSLVEDSWINAQASTHDLAELEDCAIAVDATYYIHLFVDNSPSHEPLLPAMGGLTGIEGHIDDDLDQWQEHRITPFFIFDGQSITGQDEVAVKRGRAANYKTDQAWDLYFHGNAEEAVNAFGANSGAFPIRSLYPMLMIKLKKRGLHFLVPPYNASAQLAYFDMIDSDQCAGIMGTQELLLYPIKDSLIRSMDWNKKTVSSISKKNVIRTLNVSEPMFIDALLMTGTTFLPPFPPLRDSSIIRTQPSTILDAVNLLRTSEKSISNACASFGDILQAQDPNWLDKYRKARLAVDHFIYIAESGEVQVHDYERLTGDNHEYLGLQLPGELFHYLNTGLIGSSILNAITHGQIWVPPTLDGVNAPEYRTLVTNHLVPIKEQTLALLIPRLHRGIQHKSITMKVWFDDKFSYTFNHLTLQPSPSQRAATWDVKVATLKELFPAYPPGMIPTAILALQNPDFVRNTFAKEKRIIRGIDTLDDIASVAIWRFLHLRGYVNEQHNLTIWGDAVAKTCQSLQEYQKKEPYHDQLALYDGVLLAFELIRFELLNGRNQHEELRGLALGMNDQDKTSALILSRCATLLKLRHETNGYTGPLNKNLLAFRSLASAVREADRDLVEAIVASMFMHAQSVRDRDDQFEINRRLPFAHSPDIGLGIAFKTFLDETPSSETKQERETRMLGFPEKFVPFATHFKEDIEMCVAFFRALYAGMKVAEKEIPTGDMQAWAQANEFLKTRQY